MAMHDDSAQSYGIEHHKHRFAAWAACRAASVVNCRFSVAQGRAVLEASGFTASFYRPEQLPNPEPIAVDDTHREWRNAVVREAETRGLSFTHGVAAKLVNIYLKSRFVCGGYHEHPRVQGLHPPIDSVLLRRLAAENVGGHEREWKQAAKTRWSKFDSGDYERVIVLIRHASGVQPLWKIEWHWSGNQ
jgi:hypothetical protein